MIRVVFDTSVLYSAILKPKGVPAAVFDFVSSGLVIPCVSPAVLAEYRDVLLDRPALRPYAQQAQRVLDILTSVAVEVTASQPLRISDHESDNRFYECAEAASADYIITGNLKHFKQSHKNTRIVNPRQFLELLARTHGQK
jgi:putative PIN family toxin of toxin-antitoxin system